MILQLLREVSPSSYDPKPVQVSKWEAHDKRDDDERGEATWNRSGQIIATSPDLTLNGGLVREISFFQEIWVGEILYDSFVKC